MQRATRHTGSAVEALAVGAVGAVLGWLVGGLIHPAAGVVMAVVAGLNGLLSGWRQIYDWRSRRGVLAYLLDTTWASLPILAGLIAHLVAVVRHGGYESSLSRRQNRHVYRGGAHLQAGFALTVGNVISSAGDLSRERRRKLITDHESVHIGQARCLGPLYLPLYLLWTGVGAVAGVCVWFRRGRKEPIGKVIESCSYYLNPFEWWAYSRDDLWPPPGLISGFGWRQPLVRPLADTHRYGDFHDPR
jgi:hypothetical protein